MAVPLDIVRSPEADTDLHLIWAYVAERDINAADRLIDMIVGATARLADHPHSGSPCFGIAPDLRSIPCGRYTIYYRPEADRVRVVRIFHGARDVRSGSIG